MLTDMVIGTLYQIKEKWQVFLEMYLKRRNPTVVICCDGQSHAQSLDLCADVDFKEMPLWCKSYWHENKDVEREQRTLVIGLVMTDEYKTYNPHWLAERSLAYLNIVLLKELGSIENAVIPSKMFWRTVSREVGKMFR